MRTIFAAAIAAAAFTAIPTSADACNIRGEFCGYPLWAANAFSNPRDRVNPATGPILPRVGYEYERRYYGRGPVYGYGPKRRYRSKH